MKNRNNLQRDYIKVLDGFSGVLKSCYKSPTKKTVMKGKFLDRQTDNPLPLKSKKHKLLHIFIFALLALGVIYFYYFAIPEVFALIRNTIYTRIFLLRLSVTFLIMTVFFIWLSAKRLKVRFLSLLLLFLPSSIAWYIGLRYSVVCDETFLSHVINTNKQEASSFFDVYVLLFFVVLGLLTLALAFVLGKLKIELFSFKDKKTRTACNIVFAVLFLFSFLIRFYPMRIWYATGCNFYQAQAHGYWVGVHIDFLEEREREFTLSAPIPNNGILFVHIGESLRADHVPMSGYYRNTMPRMMKEYKAGKLFNFPKALSFGTSTRISVAGLMTSASIADPVIRGGSFVSVVKRAGIPCFTFFSSLSPNSRATKFGSTMEILTKMSAESFYSEGFAHSLLPRFESLLARKDLKSRLVVYNGEGSHASFDHYDTENYTVFTPVNYHQYHDDSTINAYDNSIIATDDFIGSITDMLKDKSAVYIYVSDHGEMLGENGVWNRLGNDPMDIAPMRYIAFFIWVSGSFKRDESAKFRILKSNAERLSAVSHDHIYHTVLGFFNIRNREYDASLDLFSKEAKPFEGPFPEDLPAGTRFKRLRFEY